MKIINDWDKNAMRDIIVAVMLVCVIWFFIYTMFGIPVFFK